MIANEILTQLENERARQETCPCRFCSSQPEFHRSEKLIVLRCSKCSMIARGYISIGCIKSEGQARTAARKLLSSWNERNAC